jgi:hypothetical protein
MSSSKLDLLDQQAINPANYGLIHLVSTYPSMYVVEEERTG